MIVTRKLEFHSSTYNLEEALCENLRKLWQQGDANYYRGIANSLHHFMMISDNGSIDTSVIRASWRWDSEKLFTIALEVSSEE